MRDNVELNKKINRINQSFILFIPVGIAVGAALGIALDNIPVWTAAGTGVGILFGLISIKKKK